MTRQTLRCLWENQKQEEMQERRKATENRLNAIGLQLMNLKQGQKKKVEGKFVIVRPEGFRISGKTLNIGEAVAALAIG